MRLIKKRKNWISGLLCILMLTMTMQIISYAAESGDADLKQDVQIRETPMESGEADISLDNDELFEEYVNQLFYGTTPAAQNKLRKASARVKLSKNEQVVYDYLLIYAKKLASGESDTAIINIPIGEIGGDMYSAEELGLATILNDSGELSDEAQAAIQQKSSVDMQKVLHALLADCPYELYWFDKTAGYSWKYPDITFYVTEKGPAGYQTNDYLTIYMSVAQEYASGEYVSLNGQSIWIGTDTVKTGAASKAVNNAQKIVADYASLSDYEKLMQYKETICEWTDYNHAAADSSIGYGNPWQLIWVFDGDASTDVVCEGYAKAFQYLCDQSTFSEDIDCFTVTGTMKGGTGNAGHMWNIVHMDDGQNYLVDLTNCDTGNIGYPDGLFLKGYSEKSTLEVKEAAGGYVTMEYVFEPNSATISYVYDLDTVKMYLEEELALSSEDYLLPGHVHEWDSQVISEPTLDEEGKKLYTCRICGRTKTESIPVKETETIKKADISGIVDRLYTGQEIKQNPTVKVNGNILKEGIDYILTYKNNIGNGTASVVITGAGRYTDAVTKHFTIKPPVLMVKSLWASRHDIGKVLFKWTKKDFTNVTGWKLKYRIRKIGGDNTWSGWSYKTYSNGTMEALLSVPRDYVIEIHAQALGDKSWSTGIITTPAGGKYQAMKYVYVKNDLTNKRLDSIALKVGQTIKLKPDYVYPVADYNKRPRLYPTQALWDLDEAGKAMLSITKPDGSVYTAGMIDGAATIKAKKAGTTILICRAPNGRTKVLKVTVTK